MLVDLLSPANYIMVNRDAIKILGLNTAVYCSELLTIYKKVVKKKAFLEDNFFRVDRGYIEEQTSLDVNSQLACDLNLKKVNIIKINEENPDIIFFDVEIFSSVLASEDVKLIDSVSKKVKVSKPRGVNDGGRKRIIQNLKDSIRCNNYDILVALRDWIDAVTADPKKYLSIQQVELFKDKLEEYCEGNAEVALNVIKQATIHQYIDCQWAINSYEKDKKQQTFYNGSYNKNNSILRTTEQKTTSKTQVGDEVF